MDTRRAALGVRTFAGLALAVLTAWFSLPATSTSAQSKLEPAWGVGLFTGFKLRDPSKPYNSSTNPVIESRAWYTPVTELGPVVFSASIVTDRLSGQFCDKIQEGLSPADREQYNCGGVYYSIYRTEAEARQFLDRRLAQLRGSPSRWDIRMIEGVRIQTRDNARIMAPGTTAAPRPSSASVSEAEAIARAQQSEQRNAELAAERAATDRLNSEMAGQDAAVVARNRARAAEYARQQEEHRRQVAAAEAEAERIRRADAAAKADYERRMQAWRKAVEECKAGKRAACVSPM